MLLGPRGYCVGHNDSVVLLGWWDYGRPFTGAREVILNLHGTDASDGPLFPGFRIAGKLGLFDRAVIVPYWSVLLAWLMTWMASGLYLRRIGKRTPIFSPALTGGCVSLAHRAKRLRFFGLTSLRIFGFSSRKERW